MTPEEEVAALKVVLAGYVRDIEYANAQVESFETQINRDLITIKGLQDQLREIRSAWSGSRHYKRLRQYRTRLTTAENEIQRLRDMI